MRQSTFSLRLSLWLLGLGAACAGCKGGCAKTEPKARAGAESTAEPARGLSPTQSTHPVRCVADARFPRFLSVAEASGATEVEVTPGERALAVVADSGHDGALLIVPIADPGRARGLVLPLDQAASDDVEGLAARGGVLYTLTSSGAVQAFEPDGRGGMRSLGAAYAIGKPPFSCELTGVNCGKNWEGLCLRGASLPGRCAGYAASKTESALYCVLAAPSASGPPTLVIDTLKPPLKLDLPKKALADCAFGTEGGPAEQVLVITTNVHHGSRSYVVDESSGALARIDVSGHVTNEAVAIDKSGALYQMMDDNRSPSIASRASCEGWR